MSDLGERLRQLPAVESLLQQLQGEFPSRALCLAAVRRAVDAAREQVKAGAAAPAPDALVASVRADLAARAAVSLVPVINATGVILHTNLGRAPLPAFAPLGGYSNLEFDLATGKRGKRDVHTAGLIEQLFGLPGIAVNNNAAAIFLVLHELAAGSEVIVSRGELVEIGDGFRIPDIMARSGAVLREVGTTNRTRIADYRAALTDRTRMILRVHPSNFRIEGFTEKPDVSELVALGRERGVLVYEDLGSGCVADLREYGVAEPTIAASVRAGVDVISFSGDKLLGGPQAGLIIGRADLVQRVRRNPLFRAFRLDKLLVQALAAALHAWVWDEGRSLPAMQMLREPAESIRARADRLLQQWGQPGVEVQHGESMIGGGSTPEQPLPSYLLALPEQHARRWEQELRTGRPPVIGRMEKGRLLLDLRTVFREQEPMLLERLRALT